MDSKKTYITLTCSSCGTAYEITVNNSKRRIRNGVPNLCKSCMSVYMHDLSRKSPEERKAISDKISAKKIEYWKNPKHKEEMSKKISNYRKNLSDEEKQQISEREKMKWAMLSDEEKKDIYTRLNNARQDWLNNLSGEDKIAHDEKIKAAWRKKSDEEMKEYSDKRKEIWKNKTLDEKNEIINRLSNSYRNWVDNLTVEEQEAIAIKKSKSMRDWWENASDSDKTRFAKLRVGALRGSSNGLTKKFEGLFNDSGLADEFYLIKEYPTSSDTYKHYWDYGVFNKFHQLVMLIDIDGGFIHGDDADYNGKQSVEEYDEARSLSIDNEVPCSIIAENSVIESFEWIKQGILMDYDQYTHSMLNLMKALPFPYPHHKTIQLLRSYDSLRKVTINDKFNINIRFGDRLIYEFHHSIYHDHYLDDISTYNLWNDDKLLEMAILNHTIYQTHLNPNKILQGFNISDKGKRMNIFSAAISRQIIAKYLSEYNEIFDPFSGYSGRMLGAISLGKTYIGQDISERHVAESNNLLIFLNKYKVKFDASVVQKDTLNSTGKYETLFTYPPSKDEVFEDIPITDKTEDEWIDICLERFKCKQYLFIVRETSKYKNYIVDVIDFPHKYRGIKEYIVLI